MKLLTSINKYFLLLILLCSITAKAEYYPSAIITLSEAISHHVLIAEKSTHTLYLYENVESKPRLIKSFTMVSGKVMGDKQFEGDFKTPEGVYTLNKFIPHTSLIKMYGAKVGDIYGSGAFTLNYPNTVDLKRGKTGGGIWLHSTNDPSRLDKGLDSRGCMVIANKELKEVGMYIELYKTPIIVTHKLNYLNRTAWEQTRDEVNQFLKNWLQSWKDEDYHRYISFYSAKFNNRRRGNYKKFAAHKKMVFHAPGKPEISIDDITILQADGYYRVTFKQYYRSRTINDTGRKELYLVYDDRYQLKIIDEIWYSSGVPEDGIASFTPSQRFFTVDNQGPF